MNVLTQNIQFEILVNEESAKAYGATIPYVNIDTFLKICGLYGYPLTIVRELQYTDKMYRDAYYVYLSHLHFDIGRHCERLALFKGEIEASDLFDFSLHNELQECFLGTMVIRPSYNYSTEYTLGRTLLNPYKMITPLRYIRTAKYKACICGQVYTIMAFPFSNQHGDVLRCAETSVWELMEYYGARYDNYSTVLPSTILNWEAQVVSGRTLPSSGLTYQQISRLLKTLGFEPRIYERESYITMYEAEMEKNEVRNISLQQLFHYYIESGIPLITAIKNDRENVGHSIIIIGHGEQSEDRMKQAYLKAEEFQYGELCMIDSASFYDKYITIDDNHYPYLCEEYDHFSVNRNRKTEAFIVPLYRHILLDAESAVNIIEEIYRTNNHLLQSTLEQLKVEEPEYSDNSVDNPIVLRYYLTTSRGFVDFRNRKADYIEEKLFYSDISFPKFIWVGEYSTFELYKEGKILGEVIADATAPKHSGIGAIIAMRFGGHCASRKSDELPNVIQEKLEKLTTQQAQLIYDLYTNNLQEGRL